MLLLTLSLKSFIPQASKSHQQQGWGFAVSFISELDKPFQAFRRVILAYVNGSVHFRVLSITPQ